MNLVQMNFVHRLKIGTILVDRGANKTYSKRARSKQNLWKHLKWPKFRAHTERELFVCASIYPTLFLMKPNYFEYVLYFEFFAFFFHKYFKLAILFLKPMHDNAFTQSDWNDKFSLLSTRNSMKKPTARYIKHNILHASIAHKYIFRIWNMSIYIKSNNHMAYFNRYETSSWKI